ncbi:MAG: hypothetical protein GXP39_12195 [Chloroflexi bacterium]|nr:hypothetical protein [Chloroflexota bacterium]
MMRRRISSFLRIACLACVALGSAWGGFLSPAAIADGPGVVISEVAWGGTAASSRDEWIELYNAGDVPVDLSGWQLRSADGTPTIDLAGVLEPGAFLLLERSDDETVRDMPADIVYTGALSNRGEQLLLVDASGRVVDSANADGGAWPAGSAGPDYLSMERIDPAAPDRDDNWASNDGVRRRGLDADGQPINGTPGGPNSAWPSSLTPTATPAEPPSPSPTPTLTPTATASPTAEATSVPPGRVLIHELLYDASQPGPDAAHEWVELYNPGPGPISLAGWRLVDNTAEDVLPDVVLPAGGLLVVAADVEAFRGDFPDFDGALIPMPDGRIGGGLANDGDRLALLDPAGAVVDALSYGDDAAWLAPPAPDVAAGHSLEREPPGVDTDTAADWADRFPPSPGRLAPPGPAATVAPTPTPTSTPTATPSASASVGSIQGYVFLDRNGDGRRQPGAEPGIEGGQVRLSTGADIRTFPSGWYGFYELPAGVYRVSVAALEGYESTTPEERTVRLAAGEVRVGIDFGWRPREPTPTPVPPGTLLIHEVQPNPPQPGADAPWEWVEIYNPGGRTISLTGWSIADNRSSDPLPSIELPPRSFVVLAADEERFRENFPDFSGALISVGDGAIGSGLGNRGDRLVLYDPAGMPVDALSYGDDVSELDPAPRAPAAGHSLEREPVGRDTGRAEDWVERDHPSPGGPGLSEPTSTPTVTPAPTPSPGAPPTPPPGGWPPVALNELLPRPAAVDWDGDGAVTAEDEWIELYNPGPQPVDLGGWALDDAAEGGSDPYVIPPGTLLLAGGYVLFFRNVTGLALNNDADQVRLLAPDGTVVDAFAYEDPPPDGSFSRSVDGVGPWVTDYPPSPGGPNRPPPPTPTPTATSTPMPDVIRLNEILAAPRSVDWDGDGAVTAEDEWIELYNMGAVPIDLGGWMLDDAPDRGSPLYVIPSETWLAPGGYILFFRRQTGVALNNDADEVRLLAPDGSLRDRFVYFKVRPDAVFARAVDGTGEWTDVYPPSPGGPNQPPTPTPSPTPAPRIVFLNEILPAPRERDWDGDGEVTAEDEWVEIVNVGEMSVDLAGWMLDDIPETGSAPYTFPEGTILEPGAYLVVFRRDSGVALNNGGDQARLLLPDGREVDRYVWDRSPGYDRSFGRQPDGSGEWVEGLLPSPGRPNPPRAVPHHDEGTRSAATVASPTPSPPTPTPTPRPVQVVSIARARMRADGDLACVRGQVTAPPRVFGRSIYVQDPSGGIQVYMGRGEWPDLREGDWVEACGRLADFHGERELKIRPPGGLRRIGGGPPLAPVLLRGDRLGEAYEGMLAMVVGRVVGFGPRELRLDDGRGQVRIYVRESLGWKRPWVERGQWWSAIGIVSQYVVREGDAGGYRLLPRYEWDLAPMPEYLPDIGAAVSDAE